jgi:predicted transposase YdaD
MAKTDSPLKRLVNFFITDFVAWLLNAQVREVHTLNVELSAEPIQADQIFQVTLTDGRTQILHFEFQGHRSHRPMPERMLDYMSRLRLAYPHLDLCSVVFYVGHGAGHDDNGQHQVHCSRGDASLVWNYQVIHLWQMEAEALYDLNQPALLPLVGQTHIDNPSELFPKIVERLKAIPDLQMQSRLFTALVALMSDQEMIEMVEKLIDEEGLLLDTPYLRRIREEGWEEGREEGREEGLQEGRQEGISEAFRQNM